MINPYHTMITATMVRFHTPQLDTIWIESGREHEECAECQYQYTMPPPCGPHPAGPVACCEYDLITPNMLRLNQLQSAAWSINVWLGDYGKKTDDQGLVDFMYRELQELDREVRRRTEYEL